MSRGLAGIVFVCLLAAAVAVTAVITSDIVTRGLAANAAAQVAMPSPATSETPATFSAERPHVAHAPTEAPAAQPPDEAPAAAAEKLAIADPKAFVNGLSPEEQQKLARVLMDRRLVEIRKQNSYILPTDYRLRGLAKVQDGHLALTEGQQQAVETIRESFKPRIDAATADLLRRDEDVRRRIQQKAEALGPAGTGGQADGMTELQQEWSKIRQETREVKAEIDKDYMAAVEGVLTPEQNGALSGVPLPPGLVGGSDNRP